MEDQLLDHILTGTFTKSVLHRRISLLRACIAAVFFTDIEISLQDKIDNFISQEKLDPTESAFLRSCAVTFFPNISRKAIPVLTSKLDDIVSKIPVVTLSVPIEIPQVEAERIGQFVRRTFGKTAVVDLKINPAIIGGCAVSWKGV